jgi:hypothetical protein
MARSPLFDIYDPYGILQQQAEMGLLDDDGEPLGIVPLGGRQPRISDLMPREEQSGLLNRLAAAGSSGLAGLGWILDTPGSMVRGLLSEGPGKALSALWETSDDRVTGRELLRQYGMVGSEDNWGNFGGGLAAEMLLDPLTYASLGLNQLLGAPAKTLAGKAAQKAGMLQDFDLYARNTMNMGRRQGMREATARQLLGDMTPEAAAEAQQRFAQNMPSLKGLEAGPMKDALEEALDAPLARMNRVGIPGFTEGATDLFGETVGDAVAKFGDDLGEGLMTNPYTGPVLTRLNAAVGDADVLGMTDYDRQWEAKELASLRRKRMSQDRRMLGDLQMQADKALRDRGYSLNNPVVSEALAVYAERPDLVPDEVSHLFDLPEMQRLTGFWEGYRDMAPVQAKRRGLRLDELNSRAGTGFFPRQQSSFDVPQAPAWPKGVTPPDGVKKQYSRGNRRVNFTDNYGRARREYLDVMGGRDTINRMSLDKELAPALREADNVQARALLEDWAARNLDPDEMGLYGWMNATDTRVQDKIDALNAEFDRLYERAGGPTSRTEKIQKQIDDLMESAGDPEYLYQAPALPSSHPLMQQASTLQEQVRAAEAGGELHRAGELKRQLDSVTAQLPEEARTAWSDSLYSQLADFLRAMDPQHAKTGRPIFGQNSFNEMARYVTGRGRVETDADFMLNLLKKQADSANADDVVGGVNYTADEALSRLGLKGEDALSVLEGTIGRPLSEVSFPKKFIDDWSRVVDSGRMPPELTPVAEKANDFLRSFKTLALAWPSRLSRDAYSGAFAAAMKNSFNPIDWYTGTQLRKGNYDPLVKPMLGGLIPPRLAGVPEYEELLRTNPEEAVRKFLLDAGGEGLGTSTASDEMLDGVANAGMRELYPGGARPEPGDLKRRFWNPDRTLREAARDYNPFAVRGGNGNRNPILEAFDRGAEITDAGNRYGTYLNQIRQGAAPPEAARVANLTQVDYRPEAFTDFERNVLKRWVFPFYSYTRGIMPLIGEELLERPAGAMGKSVRAITRGSEPSEENFTPEYLRQSASIPLPPGMAMFGLDEDSPLKRYLTNIDLPFESVINLITPGVGNNPLEVAGNTLSKTAMNLLGQTNPMIKGPLEQVTNRQFFSGRQLSDLYSMLEQSIGAPGRPLEQALVNMPGGSRILGTIRQLSDDRLDASEKYSKFLVNALTGLKFQDVDQERTKRLAARDMLNNLLETTPGVRTYENITVPEDVLRRMPEQQRQMYLLYKIIQSEAAKRARERKQTAMDPMELLGAVQNA